MQCQGAAPASSAETLEWAFEPFQRGEHSTQGLGPGLYITDQIVRAHRGTIVAESDASGTRFRVTLPRRIGERDAPSASPPEASR